MRKSKYENLKSGRWVCTHVGVAYVQATCLKGSKEPSLRPHHQSYYYIFERRTSDGKADKLIRLSHREAARVYRGEISVEEIAKARQAKKASEFVRKISYHFI